MSQASLFNLMPERRTWKVSELTAHIREMLESALPDVWVEGEVSNCHAAQSGHCYFTLKDSKAQIRCVCFRDQMRGLKFKPEDGLHITVRGALSVYDARGEYQIYVTNIEPVGLGALQLAFEQLKKKLQAEGLFDQARKKPLPVLPRCIGVVTSPTGAAIRDILRVLKRRFPNAHVSLYPVKVQGAGAATEIVLGLQYFNRVQSVDVLILARGGGSLEDLWAFNEEPLARAIFASVIPVITGVGHETDFTIADFVADLRAPTPSAAAEIVVKSREEFERHIADHQRHLIQQMRYRFSQWRHRLRDLQTHRGFRQLERVLRTRRQQLDEMSNSLAIGLRLRLAMARQRITEANAHVASFDLRGRAAVLRRRIEQQRGVLSAAFDRVVARKHRRFGIVQMRFAVLDLRARVGMLRRHWERDSADLQVRFERVVKSKRKLFDALETQLKERDPLRLLERGYAVAYDASGKVLRSPDQVVIGDDISVRIAQGELGASVRTKKKNL
ncbi:MAG TPA: exodeoxyribonuclease VII large subunit [Candidatus Acidoferrales bacterium]|jgi:exodeoxyribonuclease VII large subunit|nr:exodeoxyribonuclease VII large subunit [Candidatus Acidoferrales bacterium]